MNKKVINRIIKIKEKIYIKGASGLREDRQTPKKKEKKKLRSF